MPTITCAQHVYGSLTTEQSPIRRRGFQTLFYTRDQLTLEAVRAIETRAQYRPSQEAKGKWQFYELPQGQTVISYLVGVPEPDEFGRRDRYLAHSLIIEPANWRLIGSSPFDLMQPTRFCQTLDHALSLGNLKTGELSSASLDVVPSQSDNAVALAEQWTPAELWKLARLVCHPQNILQRGLFVSFVGTEQKIYEALRVAFLLVPVPRLNCTFDTSAMGCTWPREMTFWGQGFSEEREARTMFAVLAAQKKVVVPNDWCPPETPYEHWLKTQLDPRRLATIHVHQEDVYVMSSTLTSEAKPTEQLSPIPEVVQNDFANANDGAVIERIEALLPKPLPSYLVECVLAKIGRSARARLQWLIANPNGEGLGEILFEILADWDDSLAADATRSLTPIISRHAGLRLLFALWAKDAKEIHNSLSVMTAEQYRRYVQKLSQRRYAQVHNFFSAKHLRQWFYILDSRIKLKDIGIGISYVATYGTQSDWDDLVVLAGEIRSPEERKRLLHWLKGESFRKHMKPLVSALKESLEPKSGSTSQGSTSIFRRIIKR